MEGILFEIETFESVAGILGGAALLIAAVAAILLGDVRDKEAGGEAVHWTAEPVPGTEEREPAYEPEVRRAA